MGHRRLDLDAPDTEQVLSTAPPDRLRAIAVAACELVRQRHNLDDHRYRRGMEALAAGRFGDLAARDGVARLVEELDGVQWTIQVEAEAGNATEHDYATAFERARTANVLVYALDEDPEVAAYESLYEAHAALGEDLDAHPGARQTVAIA